MSKVRLIDAIALQENFIGECAGECAICIYNNGGKDEWKGCKLIDNAPTVESRPTGKWIETAKEYYEAVNERGGGVNEDTPYFVDDIACPKCLAMFSTIDNETERFNCCPNCGARMEAENDSSK